MVSAYMHENVKQITLIRDYSDIFTNKNKKFRSFKSKENIHKKDRRWKFNH